MPLPSSGPLSLADIQTEFGGSNPISLSEYYAGGGLVRAGTTGTYGAVPSSGTISIQNFYGTSNASPMVATGGTITFSGNYKIHTFTGSGTFTVTSVGTGITDGNLLEYLVVAGGGGGQGGAPYGGGGAGGYRTSVPGQTSGGNTSAESRITATVTSYTCTVGAGSLTTGGNSVFGPITSLGGGYGGTAPSPGSASSGGSGGGGRGDNGARGLGGAGTTGQGFSGGAGWASSPDEQRWTSGGGGGAGGDGANGGPSVGGNGGVGLSNNITGTAVTRAGGGGGGFNDATTGGTPAGAGAANSGFGGGRGTSGGSGIVIVRYRIS